VTIVRGRGRHPGEPALVLRARGGTSPTLARSAASGVSCGVGSFRDADTLGVQPTQARRSGLFDRSFTVKQVDAL
jgi:hypothetical protein